MNRSPSIRHIVGWVAAASFLVASTALHAQATMPTPGSASRQVIITQDAAGRELRRDTVAVDPRVEAVRELAASSRSLAERARAQAEVLRENAIGLRRKADSLRAKGGALNIESTRELEMTHREIERAHREAERVIRDSERTLNASAYLGMKDFDRAFDRGFQDIDQAFHFSIPRPPRPPRTLRSELGETYGPNKRIIIQGDAEVDMDELDLSNDSVEVKQYTTRRRKGSDGSIRSYSYAMPSYPTPPVPLTRPIATVDIASDSKKATVHINLQGGEHSIRLTDASGKELLTEKISGRGRFERVVDLPAGSKKPIRLEVIRKDQGNSWSYSITED